MSEQKWQETLSEEEYRVCRNAGTERPFTGALLDEAREGTYVCKCCGADLFSSQTKFDAGCGWPSFFFSNLKTTMLATEMTIRTACIV